MSCRSIVILCVMLAATVDVRAADGGEVDFNRDVRPILSNHCYACHGPDAKQRKAEFRLDQRDSALGPAKSGKHPIAPGDVGASELVRRINEPDEADRMPPAEFKKPLTEKQRATLERWIADGARYTQHWAFIPPSRPAMPAVRDSSWPRNPIDRFVLARLEREGLRPSPEADRRTLIRRVTLDLTGLPPTPAEVDAFVADSAADAYEKVVDRLLASPRYGERMAQHWLDLARYADSDGYHDDTLRAMWPYRDYVIRSFNANKPFDAFTVEQIAGDQIPDATIEQRSGSAFHRNGPTSSEGGADPEEYRVKYAVDRVATTAAVWLGVTMQCSECHDHKFDPIAQREFYSMMAFFDQVPGNHLFRGLYAPPNMLVPDAEQQAQLAALDARLAKLRSRLAGDQPVDPDARAAWARRTLDAPLAPVGREGLVAEYRFDDGAGDRAADASGNDLHAKLAPADADNAPAWAAGVNGGALRFTGAGSVNAAALADRDAVDLSGGSFTVAAWVRPDAVGRGYQWIASHGTSNEDLDFLIGLSHDDRFRFISRSMANDLTGGAVVADDVKRGRWFHLAGVQDAEHNRFLLYVDGKLVASAEAVNGAPVNTAGDLLIGRRGDVMTSQLWAGAIDDVRLYRRALAEAEVASLAAAPLHAALSAPSDRRTAEQIALVESRYAEAIGTGVADEVRRLAADRKSLEASFPRLRIMEDSAVRTPTHVLIRGDYRRHGDPVQPGVPEAFGLPLPDAPTPRLALARWLTDRRNPLPARVTVNRFWAMLFGTGIVKTANDFGSQGEWPSHRELLDWLAVEFASDWDVKRTLRLIVTSATYRQSSVASSELTERDPENRLLARGPRVRLAAETVRDNALSIAGILTEKLGGPSVHPYQPGDLWKEMSYGGAGKTYVQDHGPNLYRRGLYTVWKRSIMYPSFAVFDAPNREECVVTRPTTNTPLQALVTLNDVAYVEAARVFAERILRDGGESPDARLDFAYRRALARPPSDAERRVLRAIYTDMLAHYRKDPEAAKLITTAGEWPRAEGLDPAEHAAWTAVAQAILNLDETLTKE